jgi:hypothetical protein
LTKMDRWLRGRTTRNQFLAPQLSSSSTWAAASAHRES